MASGNDKDAEENNLIESDYDNIEAEVILDEARLAIKKTVKKKNTVGKGISKKLKKV